jgi:hypothetical protein
MNPIVRYRLTHVGGFLAYFAALWFLWDTVVVYPLKIFVVLLHESSHALAALATGGTIERIVLDPAQGGACYCPGGSSFLTLSAGYLGSLLWGGGILLAARSPRVRPQFLTYALGAATVALSLLYVRSGFGIAFGIVFGAALVFVARKAGAGINRGLGQVLGLTSVLYAILDIKSDILDRPELMSDAAMLAELTGIPTLAWGFMWILLAVAIAFWLIRKSYWDAPATGTTEAGS